MMVPHILVTVILLTKLRIANSIQPTAELTQGGNGEIIDPSVETTESERVGKRVAATYLRDQIWMPTNNDTLKWTKAIVPYVKDIKPDTFAKNALAVKSFHFFTEIYNTLRSYTHHRSRVYDTLGNNHLVISKRSVQSDVGQGTINSSPATPVPVGYSTSDMAIAPDVNTGSIETEQTEPAITTSPLTVTVTSNAIHKTSKATSNSVHPDPENNAKNDNSPSTNSIDTTHGANIISQYSHSDSTVSNYDTHDNVYYTSAIQNVTTVQTTTTSSSVTTVSPSTPPSVTPSYDGGQSHNHTSVSTLELLMEDITHDTHNNTTTIASTNITESPITTHMPTLSTVHVQDPDDPSYDASHTSAHRIDTSTKRYTSQVTNESIPFTTRTTSVNIIPDTIISDTSSPSYDQYGPENHTDNGSNTSANDEHIQTVSATTTNIKTPDATTASFLLPTFTPASTSDAGSKTSRAHDLTNAINNTTKPPTTNYFSATPSVTKSDISINISTKGSPAVEHVEGNLTNSAKPATVSIGTSPDKMTTVPITWVTSAEPEELESSSAEPTDSPTASSSTGSNLTTINSSTEPHFVVSTDDNATNKSLSDDDEDADAVGTPEHTPSIRVYHNETAEAEILGNTESTSTFSQYSVNGQTDSVSAPSSSKTSTTDSYITTNASIGTLTEAEGSVALNSLRSTTRVQTTADVTVLHTTTTSSNTVASKTTNYPLELTKLHTDGDTGTAMHSSEKTTTKTPTRKRTTAIVPMLVTNATYIHTHTTPSRSSDNPQTSEQPETLPSTLSTTTETPSSKVRPTTEIIPSTLTPTTDVTTITLVSKTIPGSEPGIPDPEPPPKPEPEVGSTAITYDTSEATTSTLSDHTTDAHNVGPVSHPDTTIGRDDSDVDADNEPELEPEGESEAEPEPEVETEPAVEVEPEEDPEPDSFAEPGPDWDVAKFELKQAWQFHVYFFGSCFVLLCVYCLVSVFRLWQLEHLLSRRYFLTLNMLVVCVCLFRAFYLLVDAYNSNGTFPVVMDYFLYNTVFPFITAAFSILFFALLLATRVRTMSSKVQRLSVLLTIIALHFCLSVATDVVVGLSSGQVMLLVCQFFFIVWGLLMFIGYLIVFSRIHSGSALRHTPNARRADERNRGASHGVSKTMVSKQRYTIGLAAKITLASAMFGLGYIGLELYGIFGVYGILRTTRPEPWPWYMHHTITRVLELLMCSCVAYVAAQPFKYNYRKGKRKMIYALPCKLILCCENGKDMADGEFSTFSMDHYMASESEDTRWKHKHKRAHMGPLAAPYPPHTAERYTDPDATLLVRRIQPSMLVVEDGFVRIRGDDDAVPIQHCELDSNSKSSGVSMNSQAEMRATNGGFTHRHTCAGDEGLANIAYAQDDVRGRTENGDICYHHTYTANVPALDTGETTTSNNLETDTDTHSSASEANSADVFRPLSMIDLAASMESEFEKAFNSSFVDNTDLISHTSLPAPLEIYSSDSNEFVCNEDLYEKYGEDDVDPYAYLESPSYSSDSAENQFNRSGMRLIETPVRRSKSVELTRQAKVKLFHNSRYLSLTDVERIEQEDHQT